MIILSPRRCQWIEGDPRETTATQCTAEGHPWCAEHRARVYTRTIAPLGESAANWFARGDRVRNTHGGSHSSVEFLKQKDTRGKSRAASTLANSIADHLVLDEIFRASGERNNSFDK